jgi:hypothetical protein
VGNDLRVVDGQNVEQPFVLWSGASTLTREWRNVRLLDPALSPAGTARLSSILVSGPPSTTVFVSI